MVFTKNYLTWCSRHVSIMTFISQKIRECLYELLDPTTYLIEPPGPLNLIGKQVVRAYINPYQ
jgi:hypothetical protein